MMSGNKREPEMEWSERSPEELLRYAADYFGSGSIAFASSFGAEDQVITDMIQSEGLKIPVFTLDTGRLPEETYELMAKTAKHYRIGIDVLFPEREDVEAMVSEHGPNLFYDSIDKRRECCRVRKVEPLRRKLSTLKAWVCGLRREQSVTRTGVSAIEWDDAFGLYKINPLVDVGETWVWEYIRTNGVPYNPLHDQGYPSIGCAPCTRAIMPGEDIRAGRWWWEQAVHRECGLHRK
ncbi:MAG: phosphoadenylyl-sulfate reductase [Chlorobiaceae bacterium]|nr:phosphoadenylyl-sulfate reductase [Chlorobiaceae bacterium]